MTHGLQSGACGASFSFGDYNFVSIHFGKK